MLYRLRVQADGSGGHRLHGVGGHNRRIKGVGESQRDPHREVEEARDFDIAGRGTEPQIKNRSP